MSLLDNKYYILRNGDFATNGNTKVVYSLLSIVMCVEEYISIHSTDCFVIMTGSTIIWSLFEYYLHMSNTRVIKPMYINWLGKEHQLNKYMGIFLQGFQEGGFITTAGLYFGDRVFILKYIILLHVLVMGIIINIMLKKNSTESSTRHVNSRVSLVVMGSVTSYNIIVLYNNPNHLRRQLAMFCSIVYVSSIWTFMTWYNNFRTVDIYIKNNKCGYDRKLINRMDTFLVLAYDVLFEIGVAYMFFYNLFIIRSE